MTETTLTAFFSDVGNVFAHEFGHASGDLVHVESVLQVLPALEGPQMITNINTSPDPAAVGNNVMVGGIPLTPGGTVVTAFQSSQVEEKVKK